MDTSASRTLITWDADRYDVVGYNGRASLPAGRGLPVVRDKPTGLIAPFIETREPLGWQSEALIRQYADGRRLTLFPPGEMHGKAWLGRVSLDDPASHPLIGYCASEVLWPYPVLTHIPEELRDSALAFRVVYPIGFEFGARELIHFGWSKRYSRADDRIANGKISKNPSRKSFKRRRTNTVDSGRRRRPAQCPSGRDTITPVSRDDQPPDGRYKMAIRYRSADRCERCRIHRPLCLCGEVESLTLGTRVVLYMHWRERWRATNTGWLACLALPNSEIRLRGARKTEPAPPVPEPLANAVLLFPSRDAEELTPEWLANRPRPLTLVVPDGSWKQAQRTPLREAELTDLPRVKLPAGPPSRYRLRRSPHAQNLSTLEAIARALGVVEGPEARASLELLFLKMVERRLWSMGQIRPDQCVTAIPEEAILSSHGPLTPASPASAAPGTPPPSAPPPP